MLGELVWYINQDPPPTDSRTASEVLAYLEACNLLFEKGFLSHDRIRSMDSQILKNTSKGYQYFSDWLSSLLCEGMVLQVSKCCYLTFSNRCQVSSYDLNRKVIFVLAK